jgi:hypothetical protein
MEDKFDKLRRLWASLVFSFLILLFVGFIVTMCVHLCKLIMITAPWSYLLISLFLAISGILYIYMGRMEV